MTPTHYTILSLPPSLPPSSYQTYQTILKRAYHRTLLRCHPDKLPPGDTNPTGTTIATKNDEPHQEVYTIDQINTAYKTLSSPSLRQEYDASLRFSSLSTSTSKKGYKTGLEIVDLDDMIYHPNDNDKNNNSVNGGRFTRSCRCGAEEGYILTESDMNEIENDLIDHNNGTEKGNARSMMIGCLGCSLWVQVDWVVCDDTQDGVE
ncbi:hypothetical protein AA313_de0209572 [Arthrobotrys entomopaga]|nr:hypothetical protein AA313_de0209572 [Arthrobotrys entomopaga]